MSEVKVKVKKKKKRVSRLLSQIAEALDEQMKQLDELDFLMTMDVARRMDLKEAAIFLAMRGHKVYYACYTFEERKGLLSTTRRIVKEELYSGGRR